MSPLHRAWLMPHSDGLGMPDTDNGRVRALSSQIKAM